MKQTPHDADILARMAPGALCRDGFLAPDPRPLREILDTDNAAVDRLGITHAAIADRLEAILAQARAAMGAPVQLAGGLAAVWRDAMGRIPCPWPNEGVFPKGEVELRAADSPDTLRFTPLSVHLIRAHGFYQGRGNRYRLEPERLVRLLGPS